MIQFLFLKDHPELKGARVELGRLVGWVGVSLSKQLAVIAWVTAEQMRSGQMLGNLPEVELGKRGLKDISHF